jgi:hypothetical protein
MSAPNVDVTYMKNELVGYQNQILDSHISAHKCSGTKICGTFGYPDNKLPDPLGLALNPNHQCPIFEKTN